jgi:hypothetical protein
VGYLLVGLTFVYAMSGLAVNHIEDWDPNFVNFERTVELGGPLTGDDQAVARQALDALGIHEDPQDVFPMGDTQIDVFFEDRTVHVDTATGRVIEEGQRERFFLRLANWLHLNRGKAAWTFVADGYAILLLFLATSGIFMLPGRKGIRGRGAILVVLGAAVPIAYVTLSGGP